MSAESPPRPGTTSNRLDTVLNNSEDEPNTAPINDQDNVLTNTEDRNGEPNERGGCAFPWHLYKNRAHVLRQQLKYASPDIQLASTDGGEEYAHIVVLSTLGERFYQMVIQSLQLQHHRGHSEVEDEALDGNQTKASSLDQPSSRTVQVDGPLGPLIPRALILAVTKNSLKYFVDYAYSTEPEIANYESCIQILEAASFYQIKPIIKACCSYLMLQVNAANCVKLLQIGHMYYDPLYMASLEHVITDFEEVFRSNNEFQLICLEDLIKIVSSDRLNVKEEETVWELIQRWTTFDWSSRAPFMHRLVSNLRLGRIADESVRENIVESEIFYSNPEAKGVIDQMRNHLAVLQSGTYQADGYGTIIGLSPRMIRPRIPNEILFAVGGWQEGVPTTLIETFDVRTNTWFEFARLHNNPRAYHGVQIINGKMYLVGGTNGWEILKSVHCFDPQTWSWTEKQSMSEPRCYVSTVVLGDYLYAMGGHNGNQRVRTVEKYDVKSNVWSSCPSMNLARSDASAQVINGKIYIAGGLNDQIIENSFEFYDPLTETWSFLATMISPRTSFQLIFYQDKLWALGGNDGLERLNSTEIYNFERNSWSLGPSMISKRSTFSASVMEGRLYCVGGYNGQTPIRQVEAYDEAMGRWVPIQNLHYDRSGLGVCVYKGLPNSASYTYIGMVEGNSRPENARANAGTGGRRSVLGIFRRSQSH